MSIHAFLLRYCFQHVKDDHEARLLCTTTASMYASDSLRQTRKSDLCKGYTYYYAKKVDNVLTSKLRSVGFTLLLWEMLDPDPVIWREHVRDTVQRAIDRGGSGRMVGVTPAVPAHKGWPELHIKLPIHMAFYEDIQGVVEIFSESG